MSKRQKIVITSIIAAALVWVAMATDLGPGLVEVIVVMGLVYLLSAWALQPDLTGVEYVTLLALPILFSAGVVLTAEVPNLPIPWKYFLPPLYGAGMYVILLAENIFNVAAERSIPLLRAARTIGYLLTLGVIFLISSLLFSRHLPAYFNFLVTSLVGATAVGQALWQVELDETGRRKLVLASLVSGLSVGELALVISFWPVHPLGVGLALTTLVYFLIGLIQHNWEESFSKRAVAEYIVVATGVLILLLITTSWSG